MRHIRDFCGVTFVIGKRQVNNSMDELNLENDNPQGDMPEHLNFNNGKGSIQKMENDISSDASSDKLIILRCLGCGVRNVHKRTF